MSQYYAVAYSDEYLEHFGIKGQKWGLRRYQNMDGSLTEEGKRRYAQIESTKGSAKMYKARLNALDQDIAENRRDFDDQQRKRASLEKKANRAKTGEKHDELIRKADELGDKSYKNQKNIEKINKEVRSILNKAKKEGYEVTGKDWKRKTTRGSDIAAQLIATAALNAFLIPAAGRYAIPIVSPGRGYRGTKYKVKDSRRMN